ncbi:polymorphic toxin-type HINT domain-containing protein [Streptomyces lunalinharesii]|uniref:Intein C-terminal splicing domain-containing protein n=1 Tax=Streptomyces lunalinharesii TaxID=333384 RepID=A0ABP6EB77_9ACTN
MSEGLGAGYPNDGTAPAGHLGWGPAGGGAPPPPPVRSWWRRPWLLGVAVCGLVLAVVAGALLWRSARPEAAKDTDAERAPFYLAVYDLARQPAAHYTGSAPDGATWDLTVTAGSEAQGTITTAGRRTDVLTVDGKTYAKPPKDLLTGLPNGLSAGALEGKWVTGDDRLTSTLPAVPRSPAALAARLWRGLDGAAGFPIAKSGGGSGPATLSVTTAEGVLSVSATAPYRVVKLTPNRQTAPFSSTAPSSTSSSGSLARASLVSAGVHPAAADRTVSSGQSGLGNVDFTPMSPDDVGKAYDDLIGQTKTLGNAVNLGIRFNFNQTGNLRCSESCTVNENVVTTTTAAPGAELTGTVNASMTAQVSVNGQSGGGCTQAATLPINGSGTMSCVAAGTAPVVQRIKAEKQREADAQARATRRPVRIPYTLNFQAQVQITAMAFAKAEIAQKVKAQQAERGQAVERAKEDAGPEPDCSKDSFVAGTPVLMADASTEPIQRLKVGDRIANAAPRSGAVQQHTVSAVVVTDDDRDFVTLTIAGPRGTGTVRSTAHHLFYDVTTARWTEASALGRGDRVQTTGTAVATVREVRAYRAAVRTYNLSVDGVHTYYVLAGDTPVLVHNCAMKRDPKSLKGVKVPKQYEGLDTAHVRANHFPGGSGVTPRKDLWPAKMTDAQLAQIAQQAMRNNPRVIGFDPQTGMIQAVATVGGKMVQFQIPRGGGEMRSLYPLQPWS